LAATAAETHLGKDLVHALSNSLRLLLASRLQSKKKENEALQIKQNKTKQKKQNKKEIKGMKPFTNNAKNSEMKRMKPFTQLRLSSNAQCRPLDL
jgi:hypothetical protein